MDERKLLGAASVFFNGRTQVVSIYEGGLCETNDGKQFLLPESELESVKVFMRRDERLQRLNDAARTITCADVDTAPFDEYQEDLNGCTITDYMLPDQRLDDVDRLLRELKQEQNSMSTSTKNDLLMDMSGDVSAEGLVDSVEITQNELQEVAKAQKAAKESSKELPKEPQKQHAEKETTTKPVKEKKSLLGKKKKEKKSDEPVPKSANTEPVAKEKGKTSDTSCVEKPLSSDSTKDTVLAVKEEENNQSKNTSDTSMEQVTVSTKDIQSEKTPEKKAKKKSAINKGVICVVIVGSIAMIFVVGVMLGRSRAENNEMPPQVPSVATAEPPAATAEPTPQPIVPQIHITVDANEDAEVKGEVGAHAELEDSTKVGEGG